MLHSGVGSATGVSAEFTSHRGDKRTGTRNRWAGVLAVLALATLTAGAPGGGFILAASATETSTAAPEKLPPARLFAVSEPGTVWVSGEIASRITAPAASLNMDVLVQQLQLELTEEILADDQSAIRDRFFALIAGYPDEAFAVVDEGRTLDATSSWTGSGFIVDENGYVVTNAHVAAPDDAELENELLVQGLSEPIADDVAAMKRQAQEYFTVSAENEDALWNSYVGWMAERMSMSKPEKRFSVLLGANIPGVATVPRSIPATVVEAGDPWPGKDVAIIKIDEQNLPTVPLGDDTTLQTGDPLYVIGYPSAGTVSEKSLTEPTFTTGTLSGRKESDGGFDVLQTDAQITPGNSGGPVFNEYGHVVGMATFVSVDAQTGTQTGAGFLMSASSIMDFVKQSGAEPGEGQFTKNYKEGLDLEAAGHHTAALEIFNSLETLSPGHPYVQKHLASNETAVAAGKDVPVDSGPVDILGGISSQATLYLGAGALVLLLATAGFFLVRGRSANRAAVPQLSSPGLAVPNGTSDIGSSDIGRAPAAKATTDLVCRGCGSRLSAGDHFCKECGMHVQ